MTETPGQSASAVLVYEALAQELERVAVRHAFGLMSEDVAKLIVHATTEGLLEFHTSRHESVGLMMADGYAWATGELGIAILGRGPGLGNSVTALRTARQAKRRLVVISGTAAAGQSRVVGRQGRRPAGSRGRGRGPVSRSAAPNRRRRCVS